MATMADPMRTNTIESALSQLGQELKYHTEVKIVLVGGAAGMLTSLLGPNQVTTDCDVMVYLPKDAMAAVEIAAERVAAALELSPTWLNSDVQLRIDALPDGWEGRTQYVGVYGQLRVEAVSRIDLIAMKVLAGRERDLEHLEALRMRADDVQFVKDYLKELIDKGTPQDQIDDALELLDSLELHDED